MYVIRPSLLCASNACSLLFSIEPSGCVDLTDVFSINSSKRVLVSLQTENQHIGISFMKLKGQKLSYSHSLRL